MEIKIELEQIILKKFISQLEICKVFLVNALKMLLTAFSFNNFHILQPFFKTLIRQTF